MVLNHMAERGDLGELNRTNPAIREADQGNSLATAAGDPLAGFYA